MKREDLEELIINLASKEHGVTGGQPVFEFAWQIIDILEQYQFEVTYARDFIPDSAEFDSDKVWLTFTASDSNKKLYSLFMVTGDVDDQEAITVFYQIGNAYESLDPVRETHFSDLDKMHFLLQLRKNILEFHLPNDESLPVIVR